MIIIAQFGLIFLLTMLLVLHISILLQIVPYDIVWGSRLTSKKEMYRFEIISILVTTFFLAIILIQSKILSIQIPSSAMQVSLWAMTLLFLLNTVGNILSKNKTERLYFTPVTILLSIFSFILAITT